MWVYNYVYILYICTFWYTYVYIIITKKFDSTAALLRCRYSSLLIFTREIFRGNWNEKKKKRGGSAMEARKSTIQSRYHRTIWRSISPAFVSSITFFSQTIFHPSLPRQFSVSQLSTLLFHHSNISSVIIVRKRPSVVTACETGRSVCEMRIKRTLWLIHENMHGTQIASLFLLFTWMIEQSEHYFLHLGILIALSFPTFRGQYLFCKTKKNISTPLQNL